MFISSPNAHGDTLTALNRLREAAGVHRLDESAAGWILTGPHRANGLAGTQTLRFDRDGRFHRAVESGLPVVEAFDGEEGWRTDFSGMPAPLEMAQLSRTQIEVWVTTGLWLVNPALLEVVSVEEGSADGGTTDDGTTDGAASATLRLTVRVPDSPLLAEIVADAATGRILRLEASGVEGLVTVEFLDYREENGISRPTRILRGASGVREAETMLERREVDTDPVGFRALASTPPSPPDDARFTSPSAEVPLRFAPTGHLLVEPRVNGLPAGTFLFDTGAGHSGIHVEPDPAMKLEPVGEAIVSSILGVTTSPILQGKTLELGPLVQSEPRLITMDFAPFTPAFGEPIGGIIGYDVLRRAVVEVDLQESRMVLHDPSAYGLPAGDWQPLHFQDNHPVIPATVEGTPGLFRLDLGASGGPHGNIVFHGPAVERLALLDGRETQEVQLGNQRAAIGTVESVEIAGVSFGETAVAFSLEEHGLFGDPYTTGNLGVDLLRSFRIVFDYGSRRIALLPKGE
jgi:hypothetical protein